MIIINSVKNYSNFAFYMFNEDTVHLKFLNDNRDLFTSSFDIEKLSLLTQELVEYKNKVNPYLMRNPDVKFTLDNFALEPTVRQREIFVKLEEIISKYRPTTAHNIMDNSERKIYSSYIKFIIDAYDKFMHIERYNLFRSVNPVTNQDNKKQTDANDKQKQIHTSGYLSVETNREWLIRKIKEDIEKNPILSAEKVELYRILADLLNQPKVNNVYPTNPSQPNCCGINGQIWNHE